MENFRFHTWTDCANSPVIFSEFTPEESYDDEQEQTQPQRGVRFATEQNTVHSYAPQQALADSDNLWWTPQELQMFESRDYQIAEYATLDRDAAYLRVQQLWEQTSCRKSISEEDKADKRIEQKIDQFIKDVESFFRKALRKH